MDHPPESRKSLAERIHWLGLSFAARDQATLAWLLVFCMCGMGWYFWRQSIEYDGLIDIDHVRPQTAVFQLDINSAPWSEMVNLPGIGQHLAVEIVDHRNQNGPFSSLESIQNVRGIGLGKYQKMLPHLLPVESRAELPRNVDAN